VQLMQMISLSSVKKHRLHTASFLWIQKTNKKIRPGTERWQDWNSKP
jgi:hypothetical protein